jgi:hypothetical protein
MTISPAPLGFAGEACGLTAGPAIAFVALFAADGLQSELIRQQHAQLQVKQQHQLKSLPVLLPNQFTLQCLHVKNALCSRDALRAGSSHRRSCCQRGLL